MESNEAEAIPMVRARIGITRKRYCFFRNVGRGTAIISLYALPAYPILPILALELCGSVKKILPEESIIKSAGNGAGNGYSVRVARVADGTRIPILLLARSAKKALPEESITIP